METIVKALVGAVAGAIPSAAPAVWAVDVASRDDAVAMVKRQAAPPNPMQEL